jgi:hypothetical protein
MDIKVGAGHPSFQGGVPNIPPYSLTPAQQDMIALQLSQLQTTMQNMQKDLAQMKANHASDEDIAKLEANYQRILDGLTARGGAFRDQLRSVGILDPNEMDAVINYLQASAGPQPPSGNAVSDFISQLTAWENAPGRTQAEKDLAASILSKIDKNMTPEQLQSALNSIFNSRSVVSNRDIFFSFPGIQPDDLKSIAGMFSGYSVQTPMPSALDTAVYQLYSGQISDPHFYQLIKDKLNSYDGSPLNDKEAFADFQNYVKNTVENDPEWSKLSSGDQEQINAMAGLQPTPPPLTPSQSQTIANLTNDLQQTMQNFLASLADYKKNHRSNADILALEHQFQGILDKMIAGYSDILKQLGITEPGQLSTIIDQAKAKVGLEHPLDDPVTNFMRDLKAWMDDPSRTAAEKQFASDLLSKINGGMSTDQLQSTLDALINHPGNGRDIFFAFPGIQPSDLSAVTGLLLTNYSGKLPQADDLDNALYTAYGRNAISDSGVAKMIIDKLNGYNQSRLSDKDAFADFQNFVQTLFKSPQWAKLSTADQQRIEEMAGIQPTPSPAKPPIAPDGSAHFNYMNNSGISDSQVYISVVGVDPQTGKQCFIQYNRDGSFTYVDAKPGMNPADYSFPLSYFEKSADGKGRSIYLPEGGGMRIYTSINQPLKFGVPSDGVITAPDPHNPGDPNASILWDKTEFNVSASAVFINPTAVDGFSLPLRVEEAGKDGTTQSGGIQGATREEVFDALVKAFEQGGPDWQRLINNNTVFSPMDGAETGFFPQDYFVKSGWMDAFKNVFSKDPLQVDAEESVPPEKGGGIWKGTIDPATNEITFTREVDANHPPIPPIKMTLPTDTSELLSGTGPGWKMSSDPTIRTLEQAIARNISCAIDTNTLTTKASLGKSYFETCKAQGNFYEKNSEMPSSLQFIDEYSKVLHSFGDHQIYTLPYDDELEQSGAASYDPSNYSGGSIILGPLSNA